MYVEKCRFLSRGSYAVSALGMYVIAKNETWRPVFVSMNVVYIYTYVSDWSEDESDTMQRRRCVTYHLRSSDTTRGTRIVWRRKSLQRCSMTVRMESTQESVERSFPRHKEMIHTKIKNLRNPKVDDVKHLLSDQNVDESKCMIDNHHLCKLDKGIHCFKDNDMNQEVLITRSKKKFDER